MAGQLISGRHAVEEALKHPERVNRLYVAKDSKVRDRDALLDAARAGGVVFDFIPLAKLNVLARGEEHQGVAVEISPIAYAPLESILEAPAPAMVLALDQVQHPRNLGMILRSAAGAGASGVLLPVRGGALLDDSLIRSSAGAVFHVPVASCNNLAQTLRDMKDAGYWVFGLDAGGKASLFQQRWPDKSVLVMGGESKGLRPGVAKLCDDLLSIPLAHGFDSLNVAVAAGIALFQCAEGQRRP
ncbi:MAG: 23S rRNA (guanosine(2251)-2'-O)-methyltransferase RlmB [Candidatus Hydrogenedens sp.]|nr:23S rRNA (guanosine(2251)-2'-O)-methyltransferase RlmB [Candidatus Hydrogenedens sp.]